MREADLREITAIAPLPPLVWLRLSIINTRRPLTIVRGTEPVAIFGVARDPALPEWGLPWMLGTDTLVRHALQFLRGCPEYIREFHREYPRLHNFVHADNRISIRWLQWMGFKMFPAVPHGEAREPFHYFMRIDQCASH